MCLVGHDLFLGLPSFSLGVTPSHLSFPGLSGRNCGWVHYRDCEWVQYRSSERVQYKSFGCVQYRTCGWGQYEAPFCIVCILNINLGVPSQVGLFAEWCSEQGGAENYLQPRSSLRYTPRKRAFYNPLGGGYGPMRTPSLSSCFTVAENWTKVSLKDSHPPHILLMQSNQNEEAS